MFSTWIGLVLLFAFFGLLAWVVIGASPRGNSYEEKRAKARSEKLQAARDETTKALTTYAWVDKNKGVVRIPIADAMKLTVTELAQKAPAPANPIATPEVNPPTQTVPTTASPAPSPAITNGTPKPTSVSGPSSEGGNQPAAAINPLPAPPGTQPGPSSAPAASPPPAHATPSPAHGKTP